MAKTPQVAGTTGSFRHSKKFGFTGSAGMTSVSPHLRTAPKLPKDPARAAKIPGGFARGGPVKKPGCGW